MRILGIETSCDETAASIIEGHDEKKGVKVHSSIISSSLAFHAIALLISGGHTDLVLLQTHDKWQWLGGTRDDAAGEAFDKVGRLLGMSYPAGPSIERAAKIGNNKIYVFPRPLISSQTYDFSFSGLKTATLRTVQSELGNKKLDVISHLGTDKVNNIAASFQDAVISVLLKKTLDAAKKYHVTSILLSGGVASNQTLKDAFSKRISDEKLPVTLFV